MMVDRVLLIPARAGSKGVKNKNRRLVHGRPLIDYTVELAKNFSDTCSVILTTDDPEIIELYEHDPQIILHRRDTSLSLDNTPISDVVAAVISYYGLKNCEIILLQPTSPMRNIDDLNQCFMIMDGAWSKKSIISVVKIEDGHPARMYRHNGDHLISMSPNLASARRQDLPPRYLRNGCIYAFEVSDGNFKIISDEIVPLEMPLERSVNIDTEFDLKFLEFILNDMD